MLRKNLPFVLIVLLINLLCAFPALATTKEEKEAEFAEKIKANIIKLGTGKEARIEVKLKNGTKLKGYISEINENSFIIIDEKTASSIEIPYPNTKQIKGNNLSKGVKILIGVGITLGVLIIVGLIASRYD